MAKKRERAIEYWRKFHGRGRGDLTWQKHILGPARGGSVWCTVKLCVEQEQVGVWQAFKMVRRFAVIHGVRWRRKTPEEQIEGQCDHRSYLWVQP